MWKNRRLTYFSLIYWLFALNIRCVNIICWKTPSLHCLNLPIFDIKSSRLVSSHPNSWGKRLRQIKTDDGKYLCRRRTLCSVWETMKYQLIRKLLSSMNGRNVDDKDKDKEKWGEGARYLLLHVFKTSCLSNECKYFMQSSIQSPCLIMQSRTIEPRLVHQIICYSNTQLNGLHHLFDKSSEHWKSSIKRRKALLKSSLKYPPTKNQLVFFPAFFSITTNGVRNHLHPHFVHQF